VITGAGLTGGPATIEVSTDYPRDGTVSVRLERGRLVITGAAVQECRLGECVRGGRTCRHEKERSLGQAHSPTRSLALDAVVS
jgi:hypothetical protein